MQLKSILNRVQKHPSFVYQTVRLVEHPRLRIEVRVRPRAGTRATCSQCRRRAPGYARQALGPPGEEPGVGIGQEVAAAPPGTPSIGPCAWPSTGAARTET